MGALPGKLAQRSGPSKRATLDLRAQALNIDTALTSALDAVLKKTTDTKIDLRNNSMQLSALRCVVLFLRSHPRWSACVGDNTFYFPQFYNELKELGAIDMFHRDHPEHTWMMKRRYSPTDLAKSPCDADFTNLVPKLRYGTKNEARAMAVVSPPETPGTVASALFPDTRTSNFSPNLQSKEFWFQSRQLVVPSLYSPPGPDIASNVGPGIERVPVKQCTGAFQAVEYLASDALSNIVPLKLLCSGTDEDGSTSNAEFSSFTAFDEAAATIPWDDGDQCSSRSLSELRRMWDPEVERLSPANVVTGAEDHEGWDK